MTRTPTMPARSITPRRRAPRLASAALAVAGLAVILAGCGGGSTDDSAGNSAVASLSPTGSPTAAGSSDTGTTSDTKPSAQAYSSCMRAHGIKDFPDPTADGDIQLQAGPGSDLDMNNPTFKAADDACKSLMPNGGEPPAGLKQASLKYATCMREHGVKDFPDPHPDGTLQLQSEPGSDLDPSNPTFKAADQACQHYLPQGKGGSSLQSKAG